MTLPEYFKAKRELVKARREHAEALSLSLTKVPWVTICQTWWVRQDAERQRKSWISEQLKSPTPLAISAPPSTDLHDLIERVRGDQSLDAHEKRLIGCIVDPFTMPTSFQDVHLPVGTVDAIRTMISLPLLYPEAFRAGVLKSHSMTGALLLGPPGVGKTLLARAVARESGAAMVMIKPSDVMDMVGIPPPACGPVG